MPSESSSKAGITTSSSGERHIPASTRADGSVRKEIRIRPGYKPPEDVEVYKNRTADAFKNRGKGGVPGADFVTSSKTGEPNKRKPKPKDAQSPRQEPVLEDPKRNDEAEVAVLRSEATAVVDPEAEKEKEARKLGKKLRQARELQSKKESGEALLPEQLEKVIKINELVRLLSTLGFDEEVQKKP